MEQKETNIGPEKDKTLKGAFIIGFGLLLLLYKMNFPIPHWIFTWQTILIAVGLYIGIKSQFRNFASFILIGIGSLFLWDDVVYGIDLHQYITPIFIIAIGTLFILKPKRKFSGRKWDQYTGFTNKPDETTSNAAEDLSTNTSSNDYNGEYLDLNAVLGGVKRVVVSKNFQGGEMNCIMGGGEINLLQADIQQPVTLEINAVFGGAKIVVPSNWNVKIEPTAILGGIDDKRNIQQVLPHPNKVLTIKGFCMFGGIEIRNF